MSDAPISHTLDLGLGQWAEGADPGFEALNANWDLLDAAAISHGTEFPVAYQVGKLFIRDDEPALYKNTGAEGDPTWTRIFKIQTAPTGFCVPVADANGKLDTGWLKDEVMLTDGSRPLTGDLDAAGFELKNLKAPQGPNSAARLTDISGLRRVTADVVANANVAIASGLENGDTVNGHVLVTGQRVLLPVQTDGKQNGIYVVPASGAASRSTDADTANELRNLYVIVADGTKWFGPSDAFMLGVDNVVFIEDPATAYTGGDHIDVTGTVISMTGLAVPEVGRAVRTTDQGPISGPTAVIFTDVKSNDNAVFDLGADATVFTAQQGGGYVIQGWVRLKASSSGSYAKLELVNVDTTEVLAVDKRPPVWNQGNLVLNVAVSEKLTAGHRLKLVVTTDALDNGRIIEAASLSGAAQGAGTIGNPSGGTDLEDVLLGKAYFDAQGLLPGPAVQLDLHTFPALDFSFLDSGAAVISMAQHRLAPIAGSKVALFGWDAGAAYNEMLFVVSTFRPRNNVTGIFLADAAPSTNEIPDNHGYLFDAEPSNVRMALYKRTTGTFGSLATDGSIYPVPGQYEPNMGVAMYYNATADRLIGWVNLGGQWIVVFDITDASFGNMRYFGVRHNSSGVGDILYTAAPIACYAA